MKKDASGQKNETQTLYAMGELRGAELAQTAWSGGVTACKDAYEVFTVGQLRDDQKNAGRAASISRLPQCAA